MGLYGRLKSKFLCERYSHCIFSSCSIDLTKTRYTWSLTAVSDQVQIPGIFLDCVLLGLDPAHGIFSELRVGGLPVISTRWPLDVLDVHVQPILIITRDGITNQHNSKWLLKIAPFRSNFPHGKHRWDQCWDLLGIVFYSQTPKTKRNCKQWLTKHICPIFWC